MNQLILGDNLEIMRGMKSESIDLIYLDPPFFSNRNYEVIWGDKGEIRSFEDRWSGGMQQYILWLKERVIQMHRLLKPEGSLYLHCDWHAASYIKVHILDKLFKINNFRNEIIWHYRRWTAGDKQFQKMHDTIWFYTKNNKYHFTIPYEPYGDWIKKDYGYVDEKTGKRWRWHTVKGKRYKVFLEDENKGVKCNDVWQIPYLGSTSKERIGYPTQKPENLLERIILASSKEDDLVVDPFVGGGTTIAVADRLKRKWIGIDQSVAAIKVSEMRLNKQQNIFSIPFSIKLQKYDYDKIFYQDPYEFEKWIIYKFGDKFNGGASIPHGKKGGDKGIDGKTKDGSPIQVKQSENVGINVIKYFCISAQEYDPYRFDKNKKDGKPIGYIIAFSFGKGAVQEAARIKNDNDLIIKLVRVDEIIEIAKKPKLIVALNDLGIDKKGLRDIEFTAYAESEAGIEFFSWDFEYNEDDKKFVPSILLDKEGKQVHKFKPGTHNVAVKVIDNEGLEAMDIVKVKINGDIKLDD